MIILSWLGTFVFWLLSPYWLYKIKYVWKEDSGWVYDVYSKAFACPPVWYELLKTCWSRYDK
jgi:hypothetical protein